MSNTYYQTGSERATRVRQLFDAIAPRYDLVNDVQSFGLHRRWKRELVRLARCGPGQRALDLCCGTGDVAFALARSGGNVAGLDFSLPMLGVAQGRVMQSRRPVFLAGDAQQLPFANGQFDVVTISYGLRNLAGLETGLREMARVTRPGGRILVLDFGKPDFGPWRALYYLYLRCAVPCFGWIFHGDSAAYGYILESLKHYPAQHGVAATMRELGFRDVRIRTFLGGVMTINYAEK